MNLNIWYILVSVAFIAAGIYKGVNGNLTSGLIWVVIGVLFGLLARADKKK
ncbi:MAG: hypothetical protein ACRKFN_14345 [Desulfitobacterium sp.]